MVNTASTATASRFMVEKLGYSYTLILEAPKCLLMSDDFLSSMHVKVDNEEKIVLFSNGNYLIADCTNGKIEAFVDCSADWKDFLKSR